MKELSLNILDVAKNSTAAGATKVEISLELAESGILTISIIDNGCGMSEETLMGVTNPFYTTRKTRKVGMGLPLLKMAAEQSMLFVSKVAESDVPLFPFSVDELILSSPPVCSAAILSNGSPIPTLRVFLVV